MRWADGFIAVDWGTTNRRAYSIGADGACIEEVEDGLGILSVGRGGFADVVGGLRGRLGDRPMLLAGMVGSNRGWIETPYVDCPAGIADLAGALVWAGDDIAIVPGVAHRGGRFDVMRGEEVQIFGAVDTGQIPTDCLVCHPGTHNKWIRVAGSRIDSFRTVMTGELFNLLREHSILSDSMTGEAALGAPFCDGVRQGLGGGALGAELFAVRAGVLLGGMEREHSASFVSGLLIGQDVRVGLEESSGLPVFVMGRPELTALYASAIREAGASAAEIDGEGAFIAGARLIAERIG